MHVLYFSNVNFNDFNHDYSTMIKATKTAIFSYLVSSRWCWQVNEPKRATKLWMKSSFGFFFFSCCSTPLAVHYLHGLTSKQSTENDRYLWWLIIVVGSRQSNLQQLTTTGRADEFLGGNPRNGTNATNYSLKKRCGWKQKVLSLIFLWQLTSA